MQRRGLSSEFQFECCRRITLELSVLNEKTVEKSAQRSLNLADSNASIFLFLTVNILQLLTNFFRLLFASINASFFFERMFC